ncbi:UNVERIFIED_CONTAM: hypothetical protein K2H54_053382 [Gekko kuhli]
MRENQTVAEKQKRCLKDSLDNTQCTLNLKVEKRKKEKKLTKREQIEKRLQRRTYRRGRKWNRKKFKKQVHKLKPEDKARNAKNLKCKERDLNVKLSEYKERRYVDSLKLKLKSLNL